jgi:hypothetical protein
MKLAFWLGELFFFWVYLHQRMSLLIALLSCLEEKEKVQEVSYLIWPSEFLNYVLQFCMLSVLSPLILSE